MQISCEGAPFLQLPWGLICIFWGNYILIRFINANQRKLWHDQIQKVPSTKIINAW